MSLDVPCPKRAGHARHRSLLHVALAAVLVIAVDVIAGVPAGRAAGGSPEFYGIGSGGVGSQATDGTAKAISLSLNGPTGVATDLAGDVFIADSNNGRVVEVPATGRPRVVDVGSNTLNYPYGVAVDLGGDLFVSDFNKNRVVEVPAAHGAAASGTSRLVDFGTDTPAGPGALTMDAAGDLFVADVDNDRVLKVPATNGEAASGNPSVVSLGNLTMSQPRGLAVDATGDLFIADVTNNRVLEVPAAKSEPASVVNLGTASLSAPQGVAVDALGDLYIGDTGNHRVIEVPAQNSVAASGTATAVSTGTYNPTAIAMAVDPTGELLIADAGLSEVVKLYSSSGMPTVLNTGNPLLADPIAVAADAAGDLFVLRYGHNQVTEAPAGGTPHVVSTGNLTLANPRALAVNGTGNLYVADTVNRRVVEIPAGGNSAAAGGAAHVVNTGSYYLADPRALALDPAGDLFIGDSGNHQLVEVPATGPPRQVVVDFAGPPILGPIQPTALAADSAGDLFINDAGVVLEVAARHGVAAGGATTRVNVGGVTAGALAVTGAGDLFVTAGSYNVVVKVPARNGVAASGTPKVVASSAGPWAVPNGLAVPAPKTATVTFKAEGGSPKPRPQIVFEGAHAAEPRAPARPGFRFLGWDTRPDGSGKTWRFAVDPVSTNLTLYAQYIEIPVLGVRHTFGANSSGWGRVRPTSLYNGGAASGDILRIRWSNWGAAIARGSGQNFIAKPSGGLYPTPVAIRLRATDLGRCHRNGPRVYRRLKYSEPARPGGPFGLWRIWTRDHRDLCTRLP